MKERYRLFLRRKSVYYAFDNTTKTFQSLKTKDEAEAERLLVALNEAGKQPAMNLSLARVYLKHSDPMVSQGDIAALKGEDVDWANNTVSFFRKKTGVPVLVHLGSDALNLLKDLPSEGPLFPYLSRVRAGDRAKTAGQAPPLFQTV
jgi:integrase